MRPDWLDADPLIAEDLPWIADLYRVAPGCREQPTGGKVLLGGGGDRRVVVVVGSGPDGDWILRLDEDGLALGNGVDGPKRIEHDEDADSLAIFRVLDPAFVYQRAVDVVPLFQTDREFEVLVTYSIELWSSETGLPGLQLPEAYVAFLSDTERPLRRTANLHVVGGVRQMSQPDLAPRATDRIVEKFRGWKEMSPHERATYKRFVG